jgi:hypothetical protein
VAALQFYENIGYAKDSGQSDAEPLTVSSVTGLEERTLSSSVVKGLAPQELIGEDTWNDLKGGEDGSQANVEVTSLILVFLIAAAMNFIAAIAFFAAGAIFLARIVILWLLMILAPVAFAAFILPKTKGQAQKWFSMLLSQAFVAPVFLFFLYLIVTLVENNSLQSYFAGEQDGWLTHLTELSLIGSFYIILLLAAVSITISLSSKAGNAGLNAGKAVGGKALGAYGGAIGAGGRRFVGGPARKVGRSKAVQSWASKKGATGALGRQAEKVLKYTSQSSYYIRNTKGGKYISSATGKNLGQGHQGGWVQGVDAQKKSDDAQRDRMIDPGAKENYEQNRRNRRSAQARELSYDMKDFRSQIDKASTNEGKVESALQSGDERMVKQWYESEKDPYKRKQLAGGAKQLREKKLENAQQAEDSGDAKTAKKLRDEGNRLQKLFGEGPEKDEKGNLIKGGGDEGGTLEKGRRDRDYVDGGSEPQAESYDTEKAEREREYRGTQPKNDAQKLAEDINNASEKKGSGDEDDDS